ncbi:hypothetical protein AVEN_105711-1 [Araneus ventricosus]|uniref:Uncharacterized protein n=1 Tax=Araneus ventricosus TaxID=182803 RepID=A0A4Y2PG76_ARAVE|nr:hypothetical protein AVEN_105711-1 [Araneus ventricosus]
MNNRLHKKLKMFKRPSKVSANIDNLCAFDFLVLEQPPWKKTKESIPNSSQITTKKSDPDSKVNKNAVSKEDSQPKDITY